MRRILALAAKAAVSGMLLYLALRVVDIGTLQQRLSQIAWPWAIAAVAVLFGQIGMSAVRWKLIAERSGAGMSGRQSLLFTLIGAFFNQTLPSTVGGDAARIWLLAGATNHWKGAVYSILVDRAAGLIWLALLVLACLPWSLQLIQNPIGRLTLIVIGLSGITAPAILFAVTRLGRKFLTRWNLTRHVADIVAILWKVLASAPTGFRIAALSIAIHAMTVLAVWLMAQAIASPLGYTQALLLVPPVILLSAVPLSIAGWGVRESAMVVAFAYAGLPESDGLIVSVLLGAGMFVTGAAGGLAWIFSTERTRVKQANADELDSRLTAAQSE